jgi:type III restriction enzyme
MFIRALRREEVDMTGLVATWDEADFVRFLGPRLKHKHIRPAVLNEYLRGVIGFLREKRGISLPSLQASVFRLEDVLKRKIAKCVEQARAQGFQTLLFADGAPAETYGEPPYVFPKADAYLPAKYYKGKYDFQNHFYADVAAFDSGEEEECAWVLDKLPQVEHWVRNIANDERAYRLPKAGGDFYPDFVVLLNDGRRLIVEYKGHAYKTNDDSKEKNRVAQLAAKASKGRLLYLMAVAEDEQGRSVEGQIKAVIDA